MARPTGRLMRAYWTRADPSWEHLSRSQQHRAQSGHRAQGARPEPAATCRAAARLPEPGGEGRTRLPHRHPRPDRSRRPRPGLRHHARLTALGAMIPRLITELTAAAHMAAYDQRAEAFALLVEAYAAANQ